MGSRFTLGIVIPEGGHAMGSGKKYRVAIIGTGNHGTRFARTFQLHPQCEVVAGVNPSQESLDIFCRRFGVPGYSNHLEMLSEEDVDIAAPILPVKPNPQVVIDCIEAGVKGVMSEKPIAASLREADLMVEAARSHGVPWGAGDMYRNSPNLWRVKAMIDSGELGDVQTINLYGTGGNQMAGQGCRGLTEMALFAGDGPVNRVIGWVDGDAADRDRGAINEWDNHDQGMGGIVFYENGITGFIHHDKSAKHGLEVILERGVFQSNQSDYNRLWVEKNGHLEEVMGFFDPPDPNQGASGYDKDGWSLMRRRMIETVDSIVEAVDEGIEPRCSGRDNAAALEITIGLRESHRRNFDAVSLPVENRSLAIYPMRGRWIGRRLHAEYGSDKWWKTYNGLTNW